MPPYPIVVSYFAAVSMIPGTYQLFAHNAGDASLALSQPSGVIVTVTPGTVTTTLEVSRASVTAGQSLLLSPAVNGVCSRESTLQAQLRSPMSRQVPSPTPRLW
jgi:hypothetical protein